MTWTIQNGNKLEITACKACEGLVWKRFLRDETVPDGEEVNNPAIVEDCQRQLANLNFEQVKFPFSVGLFCTFFFTNDAL